MLREGAIAAPSQAGCAQQLQPLGNVNTNTTETFKDLSELLLPSCAVCRSSGPLLLGLGAETPAELFSRG